MQDSCPGSGSAQSRSLQVPGYETTDPEPRCAHEVPEPGFQPLLPTWSGLLRLKSRAIMRRHGVALFGWTKKRHGSLLHTMAQLLFQLARACRASMLSQHDVARRRTDAHTLHSIDAAQRLDDVIRVVSDQNGVTVRQQLIQPGPSIADDGSAAGGCFEETNAG